MVSQCTGCARRVRPGRGCKCTLTPRQRSRLDRLSGGTRTRSTPLPSGAAILITRRIPRDNDDRVIAAEETRRTAEDT